jgi:hypothetical protein
MSHQTFLSALIFGLAALGLSQAICSADPVYRCVNAKGEIRYQAEVCPDGLVGTKLEILDAPTPVPGERSRSVEFQESRAAPRSNAPRAPRRSKAKTARTVTADEGQAQVEINTTRSKAKRRRPTQEPSLSVAGCPPTYEDSGTYVVAQRWMKTPNGVRSKEFSGMRAAWGDYKNLPTKTYLKNAGKWPAHCPP